MTIHRGVFLSAILFATSGSACLHIALHAQTVSARGGAGYTASILVPDGTLHSPTSVAMGSHGSFYVSDSGGFVVRRFDRSGHNTVVAGQEGSNQKAPEQHVPSGARVIGTCYTKTGNHCLGSQAVLSSPRDVILDPAGNIYISDISASKIRRVDAKTNIVTTFAGGPVGGWSSTQLHGPAGMAMDANGNLFVADKVNNAIRKITPASQAGVPGTIVTVAGLGPDQPGCAAEGVAAAIAPLNRPQDVAVDQAGDVFIADTGCRKIREIRPDGTMVTIAGTGADHTGTPPEVPFSQVSGPATALNLGNPWALAIDKSGNLLISDPAFNVVWLLRGAAGTLEVLAGLAPNAAVCATASNVQGDGCRADGAFLNVPGKPAIDPAGNIYIPEQGGTRSPTHPFTVRLLKRSGS